MKTCGRLLRSTWALPLKRSADEARCCISVFCTCTVLYHDDLAIPTGPCSAQPPHQSSLSFSVCATSRPAILGKGQYRVLGGTNVERRSVDQPYSSVTGSEVLHSIIQDVPLMTEQQLSDVMGCESTSASFCCCGHASMLFRRKLPCSVAAADGHCSRWTNQSTGLKGKVRTEDAARHASRATWPWFAGAAGELGQHNNSPSAGHVVDHISMVLVRTVRY